MFMLFSPGLGLSAAEPARPKAVLVLLPDSFSRPAFMSLVSGLRSVLVAKLGGDTLLYTENLDFVQFTDQGYRKDLGEWYRRKYKGRQIDAIITLGSMATDYGLNLRREIWPNMPIICSGLNETEALKFGSEDNLTGFITTLDVEGTLNAAMQLQPNAKQFTYVTGARNSFPEIESVLRTNVHEYAKKKGLEMTDLIGLTKAETEKRLTEAPKDSIALCLNFYVDAKGQTFVPAEAMKWLSKASAAPMFTFYDTVIGSGVVGGSCFGFEKNGVEIGNLCLDVVDKGSATGLPLRTTKAFEFIFDWRALQHWHLDEKRLPPGSDVRNRIPSLWEAYRMTLITIGAALLVQTLLIMGLVWQRRQRRLAEKSLRESQEHMALASDSVKLGLWIWRVADDRLWCTEMVSEFYGYPTDLDLKAQDILARVHPDEQEAVKAGVSAVTRSQPDYEIEYRVIVPDDSEERWIYTKGRGSFAPDGKLLQITGISMNVTERKRMGLELQRNQDQLSHAMRVAMMGELAASLAHELSQPLAAIMNNARAAKRLMAHSVVDLKELGEIVTDVIADDERAASVIQRLRAMLRKEPLLLKPEPLNEVITNGANMIRATLKDRGVTMRLDLAPDVPPVMADHVQLNQVFINLCINGSDAMSGLPKHERLLHVHTRKTTDGMAEVSVEDCGHGITPENLEHVFEPFHSTKQDGLGMGLCISRTIIGIHGGRIWLDNNAEKGTTAHFVLPLKTRP